MTYTIGNHAHLRRRADVGRDVLLAVEEALVRVLEQRLPRHRRIRTRFILRVGRGRLQRLKITRLMSRNS